MDKQSTEIPSVHIEGGDGVGKNEAALQVATECCDAGSNVIFTNYPQYWSFTGTTVREMNTTGSDANNYVNSLEPERQAEVRAAMYALDRAFTLSLVQSKYEQLGPNTCIISDRGPYSNMVTTAYMVESGNIPKERIDDFIKSTVPEIDKEMMSLLDVHPVLCVSQQQYDCGGREALDELETDPKAQQLAIELYRKAYLPEVITKGEDGWRDVKDIAQDILRVSGLPLPKREEGVTGDFQLIGPRELIGFLGFTDIPADLTDPIQKWEELQVKPFVEEKKEQLHELEGLIARALPNLIPQADMTAFTKYPITQEAISRLVTHYPELLEIIGLAINPLIKDFIQQIAELKE